MATDLLKSTASGLYCAAGDFYVDPWKPVERAVITHAHADHAVAGSSSYLCSSPGVGVLKGRVGESAYIQGLAYGESITLDGVRVSLHPAGHILGSAQIRIERIKKPEVWVVSGDYKVTHERSCHGFEVVKCDVFITESTFGLPIYRWPSESEVYGQINSWWSENARQGRTSIILAYSLGKAQRVLSGIDASIGPLGVHGSVTRFNEAYKVEGIELPDAPHASGEHVARLKGRGLIIAPPSALGTPWIRKFVAPAGGGEDLDGEPLVGGLSAGFVSGWMRVRGARRRKAVDRGFVLSDHADWPGLIATIRETGAQRIGVTHGSIGPMVRWLKEQGLEAFPVETRYTGEIGEEQAEAAELGNEEPPS